MNVRVILLRTVRDLIYEHSSYLACDLLALRILRDSAVFVPQNPTKHVELVLYLLSASEETCKKLEDPYSSIKLQPPAVQVTIIVCSLHPEEDVVHDIDHALGHHE